MGQAWGKIKVVKIILNLQEIMGKVNAQNIDFL